MILDRIFVAFTILVGLVVGVIVALRPEVWQFRIQPYVWVVIAMALFEAASFAWGRGAPGTTIAMGARILGFVIALALIFAIPLIAGLRPT